MYVDDYNVYPFPSSYYFTNLLGIARGQMEIQESDEQGIKRCPSRIYRPFINLFRFSGGYYAGSQSYGHNNGGYIGSKGLLPFGGLGISGQVVGGVVRPVSEADVRVPADMIALGDNFAFLPKSGSDFLVDTVKESFSAMMRQEQSVASGPDAVEAVKRASARHRNQGNVVFCDGHVEALTFKRLFLDRDDASLCRWNRDHEPHR
jgi:prepilin-type processing-associated H-X9-DG protein